MKETIEVEGERDLQINRIRILDKRLKSLEQQIHDMLEVQIKNTQVLHLCSCRFAWCVWLKQYNYIVSSRDVQGHYQYTLCLLNFVIIGFHM